MTRTERRAQGQVEAEGHGGASLGLVRGDEHDADDGGQQVGEEESLDECDGAHPGQAEADDEGEPHVAERHPARVHQVHGEEEHEEREPAERGDQQPLPLVHDAGDRRRRFTITAALRAYTSVLGSRRRVRSQ